MLGQRGVPEVMSMAVKSDLKFVGIGDVGPSAQTVIAGVISGDTMVDVRNLGGVGELIGHFFDCDGQLVETELTDRTLSISINDLRDSRIVAIAGGEEKVNAIWAILKSKLLDGLITDERTAEAIVRHLSSREEQHVR